MQVFLEPADVARQCGVTASTIKVAAASGKLKVAAVTCRRGRLFLPKDVARYKRKRAVRGEKEGPGRQSAGPGKNS